MPKAICTIHFKQNAFPDTEKIKRPVKIWFFGLSPMSYLMSYKLKLRYCSEMLSGICPSVHLLTLPPNAQKKLN